jgi:transcription-repair coupling factor (superfamily II helicase)
VASDIPVSYIPDPEVRLELYARTAKSCTEREISDLEDEIEERFGPLPQTTLNLLAVARLRVAIHQLGVSRLDVGSKGLGVTLRDKMQSFAHDVWRTDDRVTVKDGRFIVSLPTSPDERLAAAADWISEQGAQYLLGEHGKG